MNLETPQEVVKASILRQYVNLMDVVNKLLVKLIGVMMLLMSIFVFIQVFCRYLLGFTIPWTEEIARYLMIWSTFLGASVAMRRSSLISLEIFVHFTPKLVSKIITFSAIVISFVFFLVLSKIGLEMIILSGTETSPVTKFPMTYVYAALPVSMVFMVFNGIVVFIEKFLLKEGV
ncbi:MAG: hypothetical protein VR72_15715 [Clostridiaceae bacterium BRH_c20a]|nr:MAG: hypothetical protein VR72_15715 [Clostridiaceae bacterium BRH_c20a]